MKSKQPGKHTSPSAAEVVQISPHGIWIFVAEREFLLSFERYPWFREATVRQIQNVELEHGKHLRWPDLDVDLEVEALVHPEKYPLTYLT